MRKFIVNEGPGLVLALFLGRLLSEALALYTTISVSELLILGIIAVIYFAGCDPIVSRFSSSKTWPLWLLLVYGLYPYPDWRMALSVTAVILIIFALQQRPSWTWLGEKWLKMAIFLATTLFFLFLYIATLAPDLLPADNGEYQMVAATLGVAHPPGFPFYTLLGHVFTWLPFGPTAAYRVNLLSAFTSTATLLIVLATVYKLTKSYLGSITAVLALASATTFWAQATTANIRSLTALFAALAIFALIGYREAIEAKTQSKADRWLILFALAMGFGLAHHLSLAFMALIFLLFIILVDPTIVKAPRRWLKPLLAGLLGFLPLLYLPLRANADIPGATANLATLNGFIHHALGLGFSGDFFYYTEPSLLWQRLLVMGNVMTFQFADWLLIGMILGLLLMVSRDGLLALLLGGSFAVHLFITATYRAPQTVEYMLPAYIAAVICLGFGSGLLVSYAFSKRWATDVAYTLAAISLVMAMYQTINHYPSYKILSDYTVRDIVEPILTEAPLNSIILADWHWATPLWYLQEVEAQRPDITVEFVYPRTADYGADWATRIQDELANGRSVISTHYDEIAFTALPPAEPVGDAFLFRQEPRTTLPDTFTPLDLTLGDTIEILGYELSKTAVEIGEETILTLAWQPNPQSPISLFSHLVNTDGLIMAQQDITITPQADGITLTQLHLAPRPGTLPGDYTIMIGAYGDEPYLTPDETPRAAIASLPVRVMQQPPYTQNPVKRPLADKTRTLIGYDWDITLNPAARLYLHWQTTSGYYTEIVDNQLPEDINLPAALGPFGLIQSHWRFRQEGQSSQYIPLGQGIVWTGNSLTDIESSLLLPQYFGSTNPITQDLVVSVRLIGYQPDGFHWAWTNQNDAIPAMGAIPTLKWIAGSEVRSPHFLTISDNAEQGQAVGATLRIYDAFTNRPLTILDERITNNYPWIPIGQIQPPSP